MFYNCIVLRRCIDYLLIIKTNKNKIFFLFESKEKIEKTDTRQYWYCMTKTQQQQQQQSKQKRDSKKIHIEKEFQTKKFFFTI